MNCVISGCKYETFGLTYIEALVLGLPIITPNSFASQNFQLQGFKVITYNYLDSDSLLKNLDNIKNLNKKGE